jgi:L-alanine-DL-glutamate epimerase-like enolase superfamily enzyme
LNRASVRRVISITDVTALPFDIELNEPFGIASGTQHCARNVLVTLTLSDGSQGIAEAAPFPAVNGETQSAVLSAFQLARAALHGLDANRWRRAAQVAKEAFRDTPSARAAFESALLDALCRRLHCSLWTFFGAAETTLTSDITIPTGSAEHAAISARRAIQRGFTTLKVKLGGTPFEHDRARLAAIVAAAPHARLVLDANGSLSAEAALELLATLGEGQRRVALFEQPTPKHDLDALRRVREGAGVPVAADESAGCARDVLHLIEARAADVINVKIMKCGVVESLTMIEVARAAGLGLMIGGMVESKLAMTVSACLAAGLGGFSFVDLDTPWFMSNAPTEGGWLEAETNGSLRVDLIGIGHGVRVSPH